MIEKTLFVIILNYNHLSDLKETIASFKKQDYQNMHLVVSDNGSTDESIHWLKKHHPDIEVLENKENLGWAEGNNVGIRYALKEKADYILLANNDLSFHEPTVLSSLIDAFNHIPRLGIIGPKENSYFKKSQIVNQGWIMYPNAKHCFNIYRKKIEKQNILKKYKIIDNVSGSFMIIKRQVFDEIGEMDSSLFLYGEDLDFSLRAWAKGWISAINKDVTIYHKVSSTSGHNSPLKIYYKTRNLIYLIRKHSKKQSSHIFFVIKYYIDFLKLMVKILVFHEYTTNRWQILKAHFIGLIHGAITKHMNKYY